MTAAPTTGPAILRTPRGWFLFGLLLAGFVVAVFRFYRRSFVNFVDEAGPRFMGNHAPDPAAFEGTFKVVSWNIRYGEAIDAATQDLRSVTALQDADVLLLQEMDEQGVDDIASALGYNYVYYPASIHNKIDRPFGNAVLSKWPIVRSVKIVLPHASPHRNQRRIAAGATLIIGDARIVAYSVHTEMPILPNPWRGQQLAHMVEEIALGHTERVVIGGDFNTFTRRSARALEARFEERGLQPVVEDPQPSTAIAGVGFRPDHIFVGGLAPLQSGVYRGSTASDHFPIWTVVELQ